MPRLVVSHRAEEDLLGIWTYIALRNPTAADKVARNLAHKSKKLSTNPGLGVGHAGLDDGVRRWVVGNYLIFYRVLNDGIEVLRYIDGRRDLRNLTR